MSFFKDTFNEGNRDGKAKNCFPSKGGNLVPCNSPRKNSAWEDALLRHLSLELSFRGQKVLCRAHPDHRILHQNLWHGKDRTGTRKWRPTSLSMQNVCLEFFRKGEWEASITRRRANSHPVLKRERWGGLEVGCTVESLGKEKGERSRQEDRCHLVQKSHMVTKDSSARDLGTCDYLHVSLL